MSMNQNNSLLLNRSVQHTNRLLNANLNTANNSSNNSMFNLQNTGRKVSKSVNISSTLNPSALGTNGQINSYQYNQYNSNSYSSNQSNIPSMIKNHSTPSFGNTNRKFSSDYQQAVRFDYSDAFLNNHNMDFLTRVSQMQRLQIDTVEWERKKKQSRKKITKALNGNSNGVNGKDEQ